MDLYPFIRPLLFLLPPEIAHDVTLTSIKLLDKLLPVKNFKCPESNPIELMGLKFPNRIGLAAGLDDTGAHADPLRRLGFGFLELGSVTPRPQPGNPKPRLFRLPKYNALINRMGFNSCGLETFLSNIKSRRYTGITGVNIGKNLDTPVENALADYVLSLDALYPYVDYIAINISSPNTPGLRNLQSAECLKPLIEGIKQNQHKNKNLHQRYVPYIVKVAPDLEEDEIIAMAQIFKDFQIDGLIATNTSKMDRTHMQHPHIQEQGGLSGEPIRQRSLFIVKQFRMALGEKFPIIGLGGINQGTHAKDMLDAGANLCQLYTGLIYRGPQLVKDCIRATMKY